MSSDLIRRIEPFLTSVERPSRYIDHEYNAPRKQDVSYRCAMAYPDTYELGQSNQAVAILNHCMNKLPGVFAERVFVPWVDMSAIMREHDIPLFTMESATPVRELDMLGITLPHEMAATNVLELLDLAGIPLHADSRDEGYPLIVGGGPCSYNPEPLAPFFDLFSIGEGEEALPELVTLHRELLSSGATKAQMLEAFAQLPGIYVPSFYQQDAGRIVPVREDAPAVIEKRFVADFDATDVITHQVVPYIETTHDRLNVEVLRGCARGCRFCQAGMMYRPVRERTADHIVSAVMEGLACTGYDEVSLTSLSTTDHSQLEDVLRRLDKRIEDTGIRVSIPSQRLDSFGVQMATLVAGAKKGGLTFAPEAGTQRLRDVINKGVTEDDLMNAVRASYEAGWRRLKLYFMCGLPTETDEDLVGMGQLMRRAYNLAKDCVPQDERGSVRMSVSCAVFVPKSHTPFQYCGQVPKDELERRVRLLRDSMPKQVDFSWHEASTSYIESIIARGDRTTASLIEEAWKHGARFDAWHERFSLDPWQEAARVCGIDLDEQAAKTFAPGDALPWEHISCGVSQRFLAREYEKALDGKLTPDCTLASCTGCGACTDPVHDTRVAGDRNV